MTSVDLIFAQKIRSVLDKLIPIRKNIEHTVKNGEINKWVKSFFTECIKRGKDMGKLELSSKESVGWYI